MIRAMSFFSELALYAGWMIICQGDDSLVLMNTYLYLNVYLFSCTVFVIQGLSPGITVPFAGSYLIRAWILNTVSSGQRHLGVD